VNDWVETSRVFAFSVVLFSFSEGLLYILVMLACCFEPSCPAESGTSPLYQRGDKGGFRNSHTPRLQQPIRNLSRVIGLKPSRVFVFSVPALSDDPAGARSGDSSQNGSIYFKKILTKKGIYIILISVCDPACPKSDVTRQILM
jgi:hypothetical protein